MIFTFFTGFSRTFGLKSRTNHGFSREHMRADSRNLEQTRNVEQTRNLEQMAWQSSNVATLKKCLAYASLGNHAQITDFHANICGQIPEI